MSLVWRERLAALAAALVLMGCAATAPKEPIRLTGLPKAGSEIVRIEDARKPADQSSDSIDMPSGEGTRIPSHLVSPDPLVVFKTYLNEYLTDQSVGALTESFSVSKLDLAVVKGKGANVTAPPGAEGYLGYVGVALGKWMHQKLEDAKAGSFVEASLEMKSTNQALTCAGRYSIDKDQAAEATLFALRNAAYQCGFQLMLESKMKQK